MGAQKNRSPPPPPPPMVYDHSLSGKSSQGNYIRKNWNISGILLNQEEIARITYVGYLVTFLYLVWFGFCCAQVSGNCQTMEWSKIGNFVHKALKPRSRAFKLSQQADGLHESLSAAILVYLMTSVKYLATISLATKLKLVWIGSNTWRNKNLDPETNYRQQKDKSMYTFSFLFFFFFVCM